jgi:hypothetical protein
LFVYTVQDGEERFVGNYGGGLGESGYVCLGDGGDVSGVLHFDDMQKLK